MVSTTSPIHPRLSPEVSALRQKMPYLNYGSFARLSHAHPEWDDSLPQPQTQTWTGPRGYGRRHRLDQAPFSLWEESTGSFRLPTHWEREWLISTYQATQIAFQYPIMVIETLTPPRPLPLTVAGVATKFAPPAPDSTTSIRHLRDPRPIGFPTNYAGPRGPVDPLPFLFRKWIQPKKEEKDLLVKALLEICNPRCVHILCPWIIVELRCDDGRQYSPGSLPQKFGGFSTHFYHQQESPFEGLSIRGNDRLISPSTSIQDTSDYLRERGELCPGVRISPGSVTKIGEYSELSMATTAGLLVQDNHGQQRLTVSNHGFLHGPEVFHPTIHGTQIGEIEERWEHHDIALMRLNPSIRYTNGKYFEANTPKRLLRSNEIIDGVFFAVDGMSTGIVFFQSQGITLHIPPRPQNNPAITCTQMYDQGIVWRNFGTVSAVPRVGVCGAAFVSEDDGGVAGFFQLANDDFAFTPCLDDFIDRSWSLV